MNKFKKNWHLVLIAIVTIVLGTIAVVTAIKLAQIGRQPIAPTAPTSRPEALFLDREPADACKLTFNVSASPLPGCYEECETTTDCPAGLVCQDVNGTDLCVEEDCPEESDCLCPPVIECYDECEADADCPDDLVCQDVNGTDLCVNEDCPEEDDCTCPAGSPTPTPTPKVSPTPVAAASPTPGVELPEAGIISPTILATLGGIILILIGLLL